MCFEKQESKSEVFCSMCGVGLNPTLALGRPGEGISVLIAPRRSELVYSAAWIASLPGAGYCQLIHSTDNHTLKNWCLQ